MDKELTLGIAQTSLALRSLVPALFMTAVVSIDILLAPEGLSLSKTLSYTIGLAITVVSLGLFLRYKQSLLKNNNYTHNE